MEILGEELAEKSLSAAFKMLSFYGRVGIYHEHIAVQRELQRIKDEFSDAKRGK